MALETDSATWRAVKAFAEAEIEKARETLERPAPEAMSNLQRGRIAALRELLALAKPLPPFDSGAKLY